MLGESVRVLVLMVVYLEAGNCLNPEVHSFVGENVTLPCSYENPVQPKVFWRSKNGETLLNIVDGEPNTSSQSKEYSGRVSSFPNEFKKGNFSIVLQRLKLGDSGSYNCFIINEKTPKTVTLNVLESKHEEKVVPTPPSGAAGSNVLHVALLSALSLLLC